jgi:hypothetical protein
MLSIAHRHIIAQRIGDSPICVTANLPEQTLSHDGTVG